MVANVTIEQKVQGALYDGKFLCDNVTVLMDGVGVIKRFDVDDVDQMAEEFETVIGWPVLERYVDNLGAATLAVTLPTLL